MEHLFRIAPGRGAITKPTPAVSSVHVPTGTSQFNYHRWVRAETNCRYQACSLEIKYGANAAFTLDDWVVKCTADGCGASKSMKDVPWVRADEDRAWECSGDRLGSGVWSRSKGDVSRGLVTFRWEHGRHIPQAGASVVDSAPCPVGDVGDSPAYQLIRPQAERASVWRSPKSS